jgi:protein TonB
VPFQTVLAGFRQSQGMACIEGNCVDARNGEIRVKRADPSGPEMADKPVVEFDPPAAFDARPWPAGYHLKQEGRELARATVQSLAPLAPLPDEQLTPPATAVKVAACASPTDPRVIASSQVKPPYPRHLGVRGIEGQVRLRVTVAADGTAQDVEVDGPAHPEFAELAVDAVRQWRFLPAKCGDVPVPVELWLQLEWNI